ncbi:MAG: hypothetical protein KA128_13125 [Zoogloea sp.]|nr:hypothetical protein [Zoogloea sp.]
MNISVFRRLPALRQALICPGAAFAYKITPFPFVAPMRLQPLYGVLFPGKTAAATAVKTKVVNDEHPALSLVDGLHP